MATKVIDRTRGLSSRALSPLWLHSSIGQLCHVTKPARFASLRDIYADTLRLLRRPFIMAIGERSTLMESGPTAQHSTSGMVRKNAIMIASLMLTCFVVAATNITHTHFVLFFPRALLQS